MVSDRIRRRLDALLDEADLAASANEWSLVADKARAVLALEPENADAAAFLTMAAGAGGASAPSGASPGPPTGVEEPAPLPVDMARLAERQAAAERSGNPLDRLEEGVFVGRARELDRLREALDEAVERHGSVVMLVGEPGIGKTRTTQELEAYARSLGAQVLWGGAHETEGAPPYWPWVQLGRAYRELNPEETRRKEWEPYAVELQRLFSLRALFPNLPEPPQADSEEAQFRLFDAMAGFLRGVSERVPLLLVLDDLHWADTATLQLLAHVGREVGRARILILGTYRDTDLDRRHPLSRALAQMNREALFSRIALRGLAESEVGDYLRRTAGIEPERALVHRIYEETEGNPFFLAQVVNLMAQEGTLSAAEMTDVAIPEGVREALGRRLDRLSPEANELLQLAAVVGREFDHALLVTLTGHDDEAVLRLEEEALAGRVIEEFGAVGGYRFTHALMQETLVAELSAARRVRLHARIAEALEGRYGESAEQLAELASHYAEAAVVGREHATKAAHYSRLAGAQATAGFAWEEAVSHYERALALIADAGDELGQDEALLWSELAVGSRPLTGGNARTLTALARSLELYEGRGDAKNAARTAIRYYQTFAGVQDARASWPTLDRLVVALGNEESVELCGLLAARSAFDLSEHGDALAQRASGMAAHLGLADAAFPWRLKIRECAVLTEHGEYRAAAARAATLIAEVGGLPIGSVAWNYRTTALLQAGDIDEAVLSLQRQAESSRKFRRLTDMASNVAWLAGLAWRCGAIHEYDSLIAEAVSGLSPHTAVLTALVALEQGEPSHALALLPGDEHPNMTENSRQLVQALRIAILAASGQHLAARAEIDLGICSWNENDILLDRQFLLGLAGDAIAALAERATLDGIRKLLSRYPNLRCFSHRGVAAPTPPDFLRGAIALRFDQLDEAEQHFRTGLEWAAQPDVRFIVDQGRCLQGLAEVAERRGDLAAAREHLDAAAEAFVRHGGAKLYLDQVLAKKAVLRA